MNSVHTDTKRSPEAAPHWALWIIGGVAVALCSLVFLLWGINGPVYIFDLIAAYCG
jgi:hypothetical protein